MDRLPTILVIFATAVSSGDQQENYVVQCSNKFALQSLYPNISKVYDRTNIVFSPISISVALGMVSAGARARTARQMTEALHFDGLKNETHAEFKEVLDALEKRHGSLLLTSRLFVQNSHRFLNTFLYICREDYQAEPKSMDFSRKAEECRREINDWIEDKTSGKITDLLPAGSIDANTVIVLVNAVYFKAKWASRFHSDGKMDFNTLDGSVRKVPKMKTTTTLSVGEIPQTKTTVIRIPYEGNDFDMVILLPKWQRGETAEIMEERHSSLQQSLPQSLDEIAGLAFESRMVQLVLPKFRIDFKCNLRKILSKAGMPDLFDAQRADLSGIDGTKNLVLSAAVHAAYINVTEEGTEAAAATGIVITLTSARINEPEVLMVDHPFNFLIVERSTRSIIFMGRLLDP